MKSSKQGIWKVYHFSIEGIRKMKKWKNGIEKGKGLDLGAEPPRIKICWVPPPPLPRGGQWLRTHKPGSRWSPALWTPSPILTPSWYGQFSLSLGKNPYRFSKFNPLNTDTRYEDNGRHLFSCSINSFSMTVRMSLLPGTSLSTAHCNKLFLSEGKNLQVTACRFSQRYFTFVHRIEWIDDVYFRLFWHQTIMQGTIYDYM